LPADLQESPENPDFFIGRAILTPTNEAAIKINEGPAGAAPREVLTFHSDDSADINDGGREELTIKGADDHNELRLFTFTSFYSLVLR
jgi:hypothetical protein